MLKWAGLVFSSVICAVWAASLHRSWWYAWNTEFLGLTTGPVGGGGYSVFVSFIVSLSEGCVSFGRGDYCLSRRGSSSSWMGSSMPPIAELDGRTADEWRISLPLLGPLALVVVPTACLWWFDRRRIPPGHCRKCGYNLTGNVSRVCPECGAEARSDQLSGVSNQSDGTEND